MTILKARTAANACTPIGHERVRTEWRPLCSVRQGESGLWSVHYCSSTFAGVHKCRLDQAQPRRRLRRGPRGDPGSDSGNAAFPLAKAPRIRDSNSRGRDPTRFPTLPNLVRGRSHRCSERTSRGRGVGERQRTMATETKTETTLMIKLPRVMRRPCRGAVSRGRRLYGALPQFRHHRR